MRSAGHSSHNNLLSNLIHAMNHSLPSSNTMTTSGDGASISCLNNSANRQQPLLQGTLYKLHKKSGKKQKYFVIFDDAPDKPGTARLEYFDNEKKFRSLMAKSPDSGITNQKRSIILCTCFNINKRIDTPKYKHVIGLYRKDDTFSIIMKDEKEMNEWLKQLLILQRGKELLDGDQPRPTFEHVWEVNVIRRGLGESYGIIGSYRLCITDTTLSLVRVGPATTSAGESRVGHVEFALANMRRCGSTLSVFFMEVGRYTPMGAGEIWMETFDPMIANNMSEIILHTAGSKRSLKTEENFGPIMRIRSQSANEASKPMKPHRSAIGIKPNVMETTNFASDSTESSFSSATSTTSTSTVVCNFNALKPKNNQTHSVSQTSLQSTGIATVTSKKHNPSAVDEYNKCQLLQCSYANLTPYSTQKDQPNVSTSSNDVLTESSTSTICHQRAFSLPQNSNLNVNNDHNVPSSVGNASNNNGKSFTIVPVHQRTRSLPLTEETAIDISQSSPIFAKFLPLSFGVTNVVENTTNSKINNNSMESIIEDYQNVDLSNNISVRSNNGGNTSILKQLSKIGHNSASSPSQLRKKRQHHNVMTASLRSGQSYDNTRTRSDSLNLSRNRTNSDSSGSATNPPQNGNFSYHNNNNSMPPPKKIPNRPLSNMFNQKSSPPNHQSPLSPPSASYSTESDGSSISIDETDFPHQMTSDEKYYHMKEYQKKNSPAPPVSSDYMDMGPYSPYGSSPGDPTNNSNVYMPMSPGVDYRGGLYTSSSGAHSRASSLAEDNEGYVPMHPSGTMDTILPTDDYINMHPAASINSSQTSTRGGDISSATSSCSITSGTPSTDIRFSEYHLDKVQARFTPCEDDDLLERHPRTYSVGSKPEQAKRKLHIDRVAAEHSNHRHRAYSVGSRNIKVTRAELTSHSGSHTPSHNSPTATNHHEINNNNNNSSSKNKKSSSAPLLANNSSKTAYGSFDHMDDLMEIDFSSRSTDSTGSNLNNLGNTPVKSSPMNIPNKANDDYINMSGRQSKPNTPSMSPYVDMRPTSIRRISENTDNDYMDMNPPSTGLRSSNSLSSSPLKITSAPRTVPLPPTSHNNHYVDMSPRSYDGGSRKTRNTSSISSLSSAKAPSDDYLNMSPVNKSLMEVDLPKRSSVPNVPDGYMEMSWKIKGNNSSSNNDKNNENPSSSSDEYINMDFSNNNDVTGTNDSNSSAKDRSISLPINIQKRYSSCIRSSKTAKTGSVEGAPPVFLPLVNPMTVSVSPTRSSNRTRCDSRDSGIVTPSSGSQATIFPFSPASPNKHFETSDDSSLARKCLVDGTTGTIKLSEDDIIEEEPRTPVPTGMTGKVVEILSSDYAIMNLGEPVSKKPNLAATPVQMKSSNTATSNFSLDADSENHDYINCTPNAPFYSSSNILTPTPISLAQPVAAHTIKKESDDYALMNPGRTVALSPVQAFKNSDVPPLTSKKSLLLTLSSQERLNSNSCFKPIVEDDGSQTHPHFHRQTSEKIRQTSNDAAYEILSRPTFSRPNSVNSEKIKCSISYLSNRPSSANSERLVLSSTSSSTSTLCSSSQTLRNMMDTSAVPSPMSGSSRPESVSSDIHMASRPPSVTSERELHYASLDLPQCSTITSSTTQKMDVDPKMDCSISPSPQQTSSSSSSASSQQSQQAFIYAQIDFEKSELLKAQQQQNQSGSNS
ncbi:CLUMA_CG014266, isoform B [Clunio marinus]|uniref:Insulin receptor substrate 1 n=1 Tax=Clunio marinus TaxID=568069 RepID=A0A1J1IR38_9DIPT|nr:CLUMA_CG014266, isoform B [Clunio marinus]